MLLRFFSLTIFGLIVGNIYSQVPIFSNINISNGLSDNTIISLEIDSIGDIWIGTRNGLNKYDGHSIKIFKPSSKASNSIVGNTVNAIHSGNDGNIWLTTTNGGLNRYDKKTKRFHFYSDSVLNRFSVGDFNHLAQNDSLIWVQDNIKIGVYNLQSSTFQIYNNFYDSYYTESKKIKGILKYGQNNVICYGLQGVFIVNYSDNLFSKSKVLDEPTFQIIHQDSSYYASTTFGIIKFNNQLIPTDTILLYKYTPITPSQVTSLAATNEQQYWIGTELGLYKYSPSEETSATSDPVSWKLDIQLTNTHITRLKIDKTQNIWVGTTGDGIWVYNQNINQFKHINWYPGTAKRIQYGFKDDLINCVVLTKDGDLWLGVEYNGIGVIKKNGKRKVYNHYFDNNQQHSFNHITSIFEDSDGTIWVTSWNGVYYFNKKQDRIESLSSKFSWSWPYSCFTVKEFKRGTLTITGDERIGEIDLKTGNLNILPTNNTGVYLWKSTRDIALDNYGDLWIVQNNYGLVKISKDREVYTRYLKNTADFSDNKIYTINIKGDSIWLATNSGLDLFSIKKEKVIKSYTEEDGLSSNVVYSVIQIKNDLWMSTSKGISKLNIPTGNISTFLVNKYFLNDAFFQIEDRIYYGGYNGITLFRPSDIKNYEFESVPVIEGFYLFNKEVNVGDTIDNLVLLGKSLQETNIINLSHNQNSFSFSFNAYPFNFQGSSKFRYKLENLHRDWSYIKNDLRVAAFTTIPPGKYTFVVSVSNSNKKWSPPKKIEVIITPPYWKRTWFRISLSAFILFVISGSIQYRVSSIKRDRLRLEKRVHEQTKELKEQNEQIKDISKKLHDADQSKLRFFTNVSHEFRTPLTIILGHLENLDKKKQERSKSIIRSNAYRLLDLVNQLIEIRKMDQDQLKLKVSEFDLIDLCINIVNSFKLLGEQKNIDLQFYSEFEKLSVWLDQDKTEKILFNLISNAIKYTPENKNIVISIKTTPENIVLNVEDNGIGISEEDLEHIFDRFYRTNNTDAAGHGIGLALTKGLTEAQHGKISVKSELNKGTCFTVTFLTGNKHFKEYDFGKPSTGSFLKVNDEEKVSISNIANVGSKILLVEDNPELCEYIVGLIQGNYSVRTAFNGKEALDILADFLPDLIISDIMMPVMDGIKFCKEVKKNIEYSHLPFIMLTAKTDSETQIEGFELGIDDYIEKPFKPEVLLARIAALLNNREKLKKHLSSYNHQIPIEKAEFSKYDKDFWKKINAVILENYHKTDFNTEKLSEMMNMSRTTFYRKFKGLTGQSASDHLRKYRLHKAAEILDEGILDISQVSVNVGFKSLSQFRINFKEEFGKTPSEYQNR